MQRTLAGPVTLEGVGLHTGEAGRVTFRPAEPGSGVRFVRTDLPTRPAVEVRPENAHDASAAASGPRPISNLIECIESSA